MTETKWTPGPWEFYRREESPNGKRGVFSRHYHDEDVGVCGDQSPTWPLTEADACLIAAAPDLYAALDRILTAHGEGYREEGLGLDEARAALAKARGEES